MAYGEGSIYKKRDKKTGKEYFVVEIQLGLNAKGKPRTTRRRATSHKHAVTIRRQLNNQIADGGLVTQDNILLKDFGRAWVRLHKSLTLKPSTAADYESRLNKYVYPYLGSKKVKDLDYQTVNSWINNLVFDNYSVNTINGARTIFSQLCKHAVRQGLLKTNPVALTDRLKKQIGDKTQVRKAWSLEEAQQAIEAAKDSEFDLFINLGIRLGLRHGEILGLTWEAIDMEKATLEIKYTLKDERRIDDAGNGIVRQRMQTPKTTASIRTLKLTENLKDAIIRHQMHQSILKAQAQTAWKETGMVFTTTIGTAKSQSNNLKRFKKFLLDKKIRYIRIHDLRHSYAELGLEAGAPLEAVSQSLGHSDIGITKKLYAPDVRGLNAKAIDTLDNFLNPQLEVPLSWIVSTELLTSETVQATTPVPFSKRPNNSKLSARR